MAENTGEIETHGPTFSISLLASQPWVGFPGKCWGGETLKVTAQLLFYYTHTHVDLSFFLFFYQSFTYLGQRSFIELIAVRLACRL